MLISGFMVETGSQRMPSNFNKTIPVDESVCRESIKDFDFTLLYARHGALIEFTCNKRSARLAF